MIFAGIDWSEQFHCLVVLDAEGQQLACRKVEHGCGGLDELDVLLGQYAVPQDTAVAVELHDGLLLDWLVQHGYAVYGINPKSAERARDRFNPAGLKDDERDAWSLAEFLRTSHQHLRRVQPESDQTLELVAWVRHREDLVQERTVQIQRLRSHLAMWHPHALKTIPDLASRWGLDLLEKAPTADVFAKLTYRKIEQWSKGRRLSMITVDRLGAAVQFSSPTTRPCRNEAHAAEVRHWVKTIRGLTEEVTKIDETLETLVQNHPDAVYFQSLPVHGTVTMATMMAAFGEDRQRWEGHEEVAARWGVAPVTHQSGKYKSAHRRRACDTTIHQAWLWFTFNTITREGCWARDYYRDKRKTGMKHYSALRCTAQRWVKITFRMWQDRTTYNEQYHQARRQERAAPRT